MKFLEKKYASAQLKFPHRRKILENLFTIASPRMHKMQPKRILLLHPIKPSGKIYLTSPGNTNY